MLLAADGPSDTATAAELSTGKHMAGRWRELSAHQRVGKLPDEPRPSPLRRIGDEQAAEPQGGDPGEQLCDGLIQDSDS